MTGFDGPETDTAITSDARLKGRTMTTQLTELPTAEENEAATSEGFDLIDYGLTIREVHRNLPPGELYEHAIRYEKDARIASTGALVAYSGAKTGRSPKDKRIVRHPDSEKDVWWGPVNIPLDPHAFAINRERANDYLNTRERLYCVDGFAGWDPDVPHQGPRHLLAALPRAVHAQHADPPDAARSWRGSASPTT